MKGLKVTIEDSPYKVVLYRDATDDLPWALQEGELLGGSDVVGWFTTAGEATMVGLALYIEDDPLGPVAGAAERLRYIDEQVTGIGEFIAETPGAVQPLASAVTYLRSLFNEQYDWLIAVATEAIGEEASA